MDIFKNCATLSTLSNELILEIASLLETPSFFSFQCTSIRIFYVLASHNLSKLKSTKERAKQIVRDVRETENYKSLNDSEKYRYEKYQYYNAFYEIAYNIPHENIFLNVRTLSQVDIERLISFY